MAAWQFDLYIVSPEAPPPNVSEAGWEPPLLPLPLVYDIQQELAHYMGPPWLMLEDWFVFGPENGNRIDLLFEDDVGAAVSIRCDVREEAPQFLVLVADLTRFHGCRFFSPLTREFIEPDLELVLDVIRKSQA